MGTSFQRLLEAAQQGAAQNPNTPAPTTNAETIRAQVEKQSLGCGCIGLAVLFIFAVWGLGSWWLGSPSLAMTSACVAGVVVVAAAQLRNFHVWTGLAWGAIALAGIGATSLLYGLFSPHEINNVLPAWLADRAWAGALTAFGVGLTAFTAWKRRDLISTPESIYAIQFSAAARKVDLPTEQRRVKGVMEQLQVAADLGLLPLSSAWLDFGDRQAPRADAPTPHLLPLLAIRVHPCPDAWTTDLDTLGPALPPPHDLPALGPTLAPISLGILYLDLENLHYIPLRREMQPLHLPLASIRRLKIRIHALAVDVEGHPEGYEFALTYAWRTAALLTFLRAAEAELDLTASDLFATALRNDRTPAGFPDSARTRAWRSALDRLTHDAPLASTPPGLRATALLRKALDNPRAPARAIAGRAIDAWNLLHDDAEPVDAELHLHEAATLLTMLSSDLLPTTTAALLTDLDAVRLLTFRRYPDLIKLIADAETLPRPHDDDHPQGDKPSTDDAARDTKDDEDDKDDEDEDDEDDEEGDALREALIDATKALRRSNRKAAAQALDAAARQGGRSCLIWWALKAAAERTSTAHDEKD